MNEDEIGGLEQQLLGPDAEARLEGLGKVRGGVTFTPAQRKVAVEFAKNSASAASVKSTLTRPQKLLLAKVGELSADEQKAMNAGQLINTDGDFYIRAAIGKSGSNTILKASTVEKLGITNMDSGKLPAGNNMMLTEVGVKFAQHASETDPALRNFSSEGSAVPPALLNGEIAIKAGDTVIFSSRLDKFFSDGNNGLVPNRIEAQSQYVSLRNPQLIPAGKQLTIEIKLADGGDIGGTTKEFVQVSLMGPATKPR